MSTTGGRIGVAMKKLPPVETSLPGASCLLCVAAAALANSQVTQFTRTLPYEQLPKLKEDVAALLQKKGAQVVVIAEDVDPETLATVAAKGTPNTSDRNFSTLQSKYGIDRLLMIEINQVGIERTYSAYVPTSDPKAVLRGRGYLVNLNNNAYEWYSPINIMRGADGAWDEPPKFPGLSNAYFQAVELGRDAFLQPFAR